MHELFSVSSVFLNIELFSSLIIDWICFQCTNTSTGWIVQEVRIAVALNGERCTSLSQMLSVHMGRFRYVCFTSCPWIAVNLRIST